MCSNDELFQTLNLAGRFNSGPGEIGLIQTTTRRKLQPTFEDRSTLTSFTPVLQQVASLMDVGGYKFRSLIPFFPFCASFTRLFSFARIIYSRQFIFISYIHVRILFIRPGLLSFTYHSFTSIYLYLREISTFPFIAVYVSFAHSNSIYLL